MLLGQLGYALGNFKLGKQGNKIAFDASVEFDIRLISNAALVLAFGFVFVGAVMLELGGLDVRTYHGFGPTDFPQLNLDVQSVKVLDQLLLNLVGTQMRVFQLHSTPIVGRPERAGVLQVGSLLRPDALLAVASTGRRSAARPRYRYVGD